jgi:hypothetical protein
MEFVYVVVECGTPYSRAFPTYYAAVDAIKENHAEVLADESVEHEVHNVPEGENYTYLYIEKGIHIYVYKLPVTRS